MRFHGNAGGPRLTRPSPPLPIRPPPRYRVRHMPSDSRHDVLGVRVDDMTLSAVRERLRAWLSSDAFHAVFTPNPEIVLRARRDAAFRRALNGADLLVPDGVGLAYGVAALTGGRLAHRHAGVDVLEEIAALCAREGKRLMLFGGLPGSAAAAAVALRGRYPALDVAAREAGPVVATADVVATAPGDVDAIRAQAPAALAVALGAGKQERFIEQARASLPSVRAAIGVGGALEMLAGRLPRAPRGMRRLGLEWAWRLALEPGRARRILRAVVVFPAAVIWATLKRHRFLRACVDVSRVLFRV